MKYICPLLVVEDLDQSRRFYRDILDQKEKYDLGENITFEGDFAIHKQRHFDKLLGVTAARHSPDICHNHELYFEDDLLEELLAKLIEHNVRLLHPVKEQPWGQRVIRFYDPDGHIIEAGESMEAVVRRFSAEGLQPEEIAARIGMPLEFVNSALG